jgi:hypothetical protein
VIFIFHHALGRSGRISLAEGEFVKLHS